MRPPQEPLLPQNPDTAYAGSLVASLKQSLRGISQRLNALSDGQASAVDNAATAAPTAGNYARGDYIKNSAPAEAGVAGSKYVIVGFLCVSAGSPGTWVQCRFLTGN